MIEKSEERLKFEAVTDEAVDTYLKKNADYGASFEADLNEYESVFPFAYEATKKLRRIKSLINKGGKPKVKESIRDSIMDIVVYGIMAVMWLDSREKKDRTAFDKLSDKEVSKPEKSGLDFVIDKIEEINRELRGETYAIEFWGGDCYGGFKKNGDPIDVGYSEAVLMTRQEAERIKKMLGTGAIVNRSKTILKNLEEK